MTWTRKKSTFFVNAVNVDGNDILPIQELNVGVVKINIGMLYYPVSKNGDLVSINFN